MSEDDAPKSPTATPIVGPYLEDHPGYRPLPGIGKKRIYGDEPSEAPLKAVRAVNGDGTLPILGPSLSRRSLTYIDPVANSLGIDRQMEDLPDMVSKIDTVQVRVDALLDQRLKGLARGLKELEAKHEKLRAAVRRVDEAAKVADALLKRHEAICKTSYWAVARLREKGVLPDARSAAQASADNLDAGVAAASARSSREDY